MEAYFDNAATTKVFPEVKDLVVKLMEEDYGNPSSLHQKGLDAGVNIRKRSIQRRIFIAFPQCLNLSLYRGYLLSGILKFFY